MKRYVVPLVLTEDEFAELDRKAREGDAKAQFQVAVAASQPLWETLREDYNLDVDNQKKEYLDDAAIQEDVDACYLRSQFEALGYTGDDENGYRRKLLEIAVEKGFAPACLQLGLEYAGDDNQSALPLLKKALDEGVYSAAEVMSTLYDEGDDAKYIEMLQTASKHKLPRSLGWLAYEYLKGLHGLPQNAKKGIELLTEAAELGDSYSIAELTRIFAYGDYGVEPDMDLCSKWLSFGVEHNVPYCLSLSGYSMLDIDFTEAVSLLHQAAELSDITAIKLLSDINNVCMDKKFMKTIYALKQKWDEENNF